MATGSNTQLDLGHWVLRLIASIIDTVLISIVTWILWTFLVVAILFTGAAWAWVFGVAYWLIFGVGFGVIWFIYSIVLESAWNATLGKRLMGLKVQTVSGGKPDMNKLFLRNASKIIPPFVLLDWLIGVATPGDKRQKYMDRVAGTTVVQVSQAFASITPPPPPSQ